ncbi:MAG: NADH-quinone oxidoreductase subunit NuoE [Legionellales bacterium]|jgi:NADH-quinone oxidoreductase subunit E
MEINTTFNLTQEMRTSIDAWVAKFPLEQKSSATIAALTIVQKQQGWLSDDMMNAVANYLQMPKSAVYEVATFYSMFNLKPTGKYRIDVCTNVSCMLCGSEKVVEQLQNRLGINLGETTSDNRFTLKEVECLAACGGAPCMQIDGQYYEHLTASSVDTIISEWEKRA